MRSNARPARRRRLLAPTIAGAAAVALLAAGSVQWANAGDSPHREHAHPSAPAAAPALSTTGSHGVAGTPSTIACSGYILDSETVV